MEITGERDQAGSSLTLGSTNACRGFVPGHDRHLGPGGPVEIGGTRPELALRPSHAARASEPTASSRATSESAARSLQSDRCSFFAWSIGNFHAVHRNTRCRGTGTSGRAPAAHYMASAYAAYDLAAASELGTGIKALSSGIYSRAISGEAVVGYLSISIPFIAWASLKRMETVGTALVGGLSGLQAALSGAMSWAALGNTSMGNVTMDQMQLSPNRSSAFMSRWQDDMSGDSFTAGVLGGRTAVGLLRNQGYAFACNVHAGLRARRP